MGLKIMCAGCSKEERDQAEQEVKRALRHVPAAEAWTVSLVKMRAQWSVTLDAPAADVRALNVLAAEGRLGASIEEALRNAVGSRTSATPAASRPPVTSAARASAPAASRPAAPPTSRPLATPASRPPAPSAGTAERLQCEKCGRPFRVIYERVPGEQSAEAPVACPHCWHGNRVRVGAEAAESRDYRAEKLDS
jgi:DNA-directed RNA polymerase subunit RPC12/RpoP